MHRLDASHPVFDGHFPGDPIVPGAYLVAIVLADARRWLESTAPGARVAGVRSAKFLLPLRPGTRFRVELAAGSPQRAKFRVLAEDGREHVAGLLELAPPDPRPPDRGA